MKNKLTDLNNHLFVQLERLMDDDIMKENPDLEIKRAEAVTKVADSIIKNANLSLQAYKYADEWTTGNAKVPEMLRVGAGNE